MKRQYLGDGLYMEFDGFHVWLITSDGVTDKNKVAMDPDVLNEFVKQLKELKLLS